MKVKGGIWSSEYFSTVIYLCLTEGLNKNPFVSFYPHAKHGHRRKYYRGDWSTGGIQKNHIQLAEKELTTW